jgi:hypothetical protein
MPLRGIRKMFRKDETTEPESEPQPAVAPTAEAEPSTAVEQPGDDPDSRTTGGS